ncbi:hypothetical protein IL54_0142 [Sphingobium sp. ba1]|jgi:Brp/Blh family beta-carotene 15,15'-monooxygenase|nr:hypothetical protein IL54_0142 [Sphingobium sp. ba1]
MEMEQSHTRWDDWRIAGLVVITATTICLYCFGVLLDTSTMTALASATLLIFGMPHGSFDLALLQRHSTGRGVFGSRIALILLYLACAGVMYLLWRAAPLAALTAFLLMSVIHFAEDWEGCGSPFIAGGIALALISAPSLSHGDSLSTLFVTLSGRASAAILADCLLLVAPTMLLLAIAGVAMLWHMGRRRLALSAACALLAMLVLPPVMGFALFFCLVHSPIQFRSHATALGLRGIDQWGGTVIPLSLGGLGIAVAIFALGSGQSLPEGIFASSFMALSVLTAPHMAVPMILRMAQGQKAPVHI